MNNLMKTAILIAFALTLTVANSNKAITQPCLLDGLNLNCDPTIWQSETITLSSFNCPVTVGYTTQTCVDPVCPDKPITVIDVTSMFNNPYHSSDCQDLARWIYPNWPALTVVRWDRLNDLFIEAYQIITRDAFISLYNSLPPFPPELKESLECENNGGNCEFPAGACPNGATYYVVSAKCISYCFSWTPGSFGNPAKLEWKQQDCLGEASGCCVIKRALCYCPQTGEVIADETVIPASGDCEGSWPGPSTCPVGTYNFQSDCFLSCPSQ